MTTNRAISPEVRDGYPQRDGVQPTETQKGKYITGRSRNCRKDSWEKKPIRKGKGKGTPAKKSSFLIHLKSGECRRDVRTPRGSGERGKRSMTARAGRVGKLSNSRGFTRGVCARHRHRAEKTQHESRNNTPTWGGGQQMR